MDELELHVSLTFELEKNAPIILLDEATASLDIENESARILSCLLVGKTVLVIARHMWTVETDDKIVILENGWLAELTAKDSSISKKLCNDKRKRKLMNMKHRYSYVISTHFLK